MADRAGFQDLFSAHAACYARARPTYPPELFAAIAGLAPSRGLAWDVGTGNGQAAIGLAEHFERVIATDASDAQLAHARPHPRIEYRVATAEDAELPPGAVDLVTIAVALHWFRLDAFYANVRRAARPGGLIAAWCYSLPRVNERIDAVLDWFYRDVTGPYWPADRKWVDERYETISFPFEEVATGRRFEGSTRWNLDGYLDYLRSWSAVQNFREQIRRDPVGEARAEFERAWGEHGEERHARWPIYLRLGRVTGESR